MIEEKTRVPNDPTMFEIVSQTGVVHGPLESAKEEIEYAKHEWPDQEQDEDRTGKGWKDLPPIFHGAPMGCVCPVGAEATCQGFACPRKPISVTF